MLQVLPDIAVVFLLKNCYPSWSKVLNWVPSHKSLYFTNHFIDGLSRAESLMGLCSRVEEVSQQAEHRMLHDLVTLVGNMTEGISFVLFMLDDILGDIILSLPDNQKEDAKTVTSAGLPTSDKGAAEEKWTWSPQSSIGILQMG